MVAQPRLPVLQVALSVGFGSTEAFARAFKARFGTTPTRWREAQLSNRDQLKSKLDGRQGQSSGIPPVAYLRYVGPYGQQVSEFWMKKVAPWMEMNGLYGRPRYGVSHDDPGITAPQNLRYDAAVKVPDGFVGPGEHQKTVIPGGKYAAGSFKGTDQRVGEAWALMLRDWLPGSGMQLDSRPFFEHYPVDATYDRETGEFECEICIPITPLTPA